MLRRWWQVAAALLPVAAWAQSCPQLGMNTVEEAENQFFQNRASKSTELLDKAYKQCRNDGAVVRYIAKVYKMMGKDEQASHYEKLADSLGARPLMRITEAGNNSFEIAVEAPTLVRRKFALVVGVSEFRNFDAQNKMLKANDAPFQRIKDLEFAAKDAREFADALIEPGKGRFQADRVKVLLNREVTADQVRRAVATIEQEVAEDDLVVLYFSSHGSSPDMDPAAASAQSGFILMHDTEYRQKLNTATAYPMYELVTAINRFKAKRVVAFLDTCYSGDSAKGARDFIGSPGSKGLTVGLDDAEKLVKATPQDKARVVITSSGANERSWESDKIKNGYFTRFLIDALGKDNGQWTISQIYRFLNETVPAAVEREKGGAPQHPQIRAFPPKREINIVLGAPETQGGN